MEKAKREVMIADHMAYVTSRLINDKKIIVSIIDHLNKAFLLSINSFMYYEKMYKRVRNVPQDSELLIRSFFSAYAKALNVDISLETIGYKMTRLIDSYTKRGMLLTRSTKYVIVSPEYELIDFNPNGIKDWVIKTREFVKTITEKLS